MWPTSARASTTGLAGSLGGILKVAAVAGFAGWDGVKGGRLSSGRAFHILAPFSFCFCRLRFFCAGVFCPLVYSRFLFSPVTVGVHQNCNRVPTGGSKILNFSATLHAL